MRPAQHAYRVLTNLIAAMLLIGCGSDDKPKPSSTVTCTLGSSNGCAATEICEETTSGAPACFAPIRIQGKVTDAVNGSPIAGAIVVARDANGAAISSAVATDAAGQYSLPVPVKRDPGGQPVSDAALTLRADAQLYQSFPTAPRVALPVQPSQAANGVIANAATEISLLPLPSTSAMGSVEGTVALADAKGTLVVAGNSTALVASDGKFTLFNVPIGSASITAYQQGVNLEPATVTVNANAATQGVAINASANTTASVSGKVSIVNPGNGTVTSVILAVASTFVENAARGESPPGLRAQNVSGSFTITGVPDGEYVVLAAFENDALVRDPDTCIGGTAIVHATVAGQDVTLAEGFKITGALDVVSPDAEALVSAPPTFVWLDDSSEDHYTLSIYDAFGTLVWENLAVPSVSGNKNVTVPYAGPALTPGMIYQFRATSIKKGNCAISRTEDLRGTFRVK